MQSQCVLLLELFMIRFSLCSFSLSHFFFLCRSPIPLNIKSLSLSYFSTPFRFVFGSVLYYAGWKCEFSILSSLFTTMLLYLLPFCGRYTALNKSILVKEFRLFSFCTDAVRSSCTQKDGWKPAYSTSMPNKQTNGKIQNEKLFAHSISFPNTEWKRRQVKDVECMEKPKCQHVFE